MNKKIKSIVLSFLDLIISEKFQKRIKLTNLILSFFCIFFIIQILVEYLNNEKFEFQFDFYSAGLILLSYLLSGIIWSRYMQSNYQGDFYTYFFNWSYSQLGKYLFSGLLSLTIRLNQKINSKNPKKILYGLLEEQFLISLISIPALTIFVLFETDQFRVAILLIFFLTSFLVVKKIYYKLKPQLVSMLNQPVLIYFYAVLQVLIFYMIANFLKYEDPLAISIFYFLSSSIGLFFVGVPAGLGIREFIFLFVTNNTLSNIELIDFIITTRLLFVGFDFLFGFGGMLMNGKNFNKI